MKSISHKKIKVFLEKFFAAAGVPKKLSRTVIDGLVETSLRGVDSHGIRLAAHYLKEVSAGRINIQPKIKIKQSAPTVFVLDADHTFGAVAGTLAMQKAVDAAKKYGTGTVAVKNSTHFGAAAIYSLLAAKQGMIGFSFTHTEALVVPFGGKMPLLGTNPISMAAPVLGEEPFCLDMATTAISWNKLAMHLDAKNSLSQEWVVDKQGVPTSKANSVFALRYIAGYKGFGLSTMVVILSSLLSGMPFDFELHPMVPINFKKRKLGHFFMAIDISRFLPLSVFKKRMKEFMDTLRKSPTAKGYKQVLVPGDPEKLIFRQRSKNGIPISESLFKDFNSLAKQLGMKERL